MTPIEIKTAMHQIAEDVGPTADASFSVDCGTLRDVSTICTATIYPNGICGRHMILAHGADPAEAIEKLRLRVAEELDTIQANRIREMASAIMETTYEIGACSDASLRGKDFSQSEIDRLGERAIARANAVADKGPFTITKAASNCPDEEAA